MTKTLKPSAKAALETAAERAGYSTDRVIAAFTRWKDPTDSQGRNIRDRVLAKAASTADAERIQSGFTFDRH